MYIVNYFTLWQKFDSLAELKAWLKESGNMHGVKAIYKVSGEIKLSEVLGNG